MKLFRNRQAAPAIQYSSGTPAEQVLKDIEIEVRRLIIEYQRRMLTPAPWEWTEDVADKPNENPAPSASAPSEPESAEPPVKDLDEIMPLPAEVPKPRKKKLADILGKESEEQLPGQIHIDEAIKGAETSAQAETADAGHQTAPSVAPQAETSAPCAAQSACGTTQPQQAPSAPTFTAAQMLAARKLEAKRLRIEAAAERKRRKQYYKSLAFQVKCNIEPLEELLNFIHGRLD